MIFRSTNHHSLTAGFRDAVIAGQPVDGGLFVPAHIPEIDPKAIRSFENSSFPEVAAAIAPLFVGDAIPAAVLQDLVSKAYPWSVPVVELDSQTFVLELFHGPTYAFKDIGAVFLAEALSYFTRGEDQRTTILVATSGDTGTAVGSAFLNKRNFRIVLLYPSGRVSKVQEQQMTTFGGNVTAVEVSGTFDDCQRLVKQALSDPELRLTVPLASANSINVARWIPQSFYYFSAASKFVDPPLAVVPSGNFGNLSAGVLARRMGLPVSHFIAACNANDTVPRYFETGDYQPREVKVTPANAMDVADPGNLARLRELYEKNDDLMRSEISAVSASDDEILSTIRETYERHGYLVDPHTAAGFSALTKLRKDRSEPALILATAHPAKFGDAVHAALGFNVELPEGLRKAMSLEKQSISMNPTYEELRSLL